MKNFKQKWIKRCEKKVTFNFIKNNVPTKRLQRLFAVACCKNVQRFIADEKSLNAINVAELYADGQVTKEELFVAHRDARITDATKNLGRRSRSVSQAAFVSSAFAASFSATSDAVNAANLAASYASITFYYTSYNVINYRSAEIKSQGEILEAILQHNFNKNWKNDTTTNLAKMIYDQKNWHDMPILADALEDAGCIDAEVLSYCRGKGLFFRGCKILDDLLELRK